MSRAKRICHFDRVPCLVLSFHTEAIIPLLDKYGVPLVGPSTGAMVLLAPPQAMVDGIKAFRAAGSTAQIVTLSNNASSGFVKSLGENGRGVTVSQVSPNERSIAFPKVKEALALVKAKGSGGSFTRDARRICGGQGTR